MSIFSNIPIRSNGEDVDASWWNTIRTALVSAFGAGSTGWTTVDIADGQSTYADITGLLLDHTTSSYYAIEYSMIRTDGTNKRRERGFLYASYDSQNGWVLERESGNADALNVADSIVLTGEQAQYKSDTMGGTPQGKFSWRIESTLASEGI